MSNVLGSERECSVIHRVTVPDRCVEEQSFEIVLLGLILARCVKVWSSV